MSDYLPAWLQPYFTTDGRLGRSHFWLAYAVTLVVPFVIAVLVLPLMLMMDLIGVQEGFRSMRAAPAAAGFGRRGRA